jgi:hypothetical protein
VDDSFLDERDESVADLFEQTDCFSLGDLRVLLQILFQVAITYLLDDVVVMAALHHIHHANDVLGFQHLQDLDFGEERGFEVLVVVY